MTLTTQATHLCRRCGNELADWDQLEDLCNGCAMIERQAACPICLGRGLAFWPALDRRGQRIRQLVSCPACA